jgi:hypothetical protein
MAEIVQFRPRASAVVQHRIEESGDHLEIDLVTAVDVAIRDLRDIVDAWGAESSRLQAEECRRMLEEALAAAL